MLIDCDTYQKERKDGACFYETSSKTNMIKVTICGSCVSRDIFEYIDSSKYEISSYFARTKIVSQLSSPLLVPESDIHLSSAFQKRLVLNDLNKTQFHMMGLEHGDFCIIDYIDERFPLINVSGSYCTKSSELVKSGWLADKEYQESQYQFIFKKWRFSRKSCPPPRYIKQYLDSILLYFSPEKIIIHKAYLKDHYFDKERNITSFNEERLIYNKQINKMLNYLYQYTEKYLAIAKIIDICPKYNADELNKWGLAPMHYEKEYYIDAASKLQKYLGIN